MKVSCSLSAFRCSLPEALDHVKDLGFDAVDLICMPGWYQILPEELANDLKGTVRRVQALLDERELTAIALNCGVATPHDRRNAAQNEERSSQMKAIAQFAQSLAVPVASFYPGYKAEDRDPKEVLEHAVTTFRELAEIGKSFGVSMVPEPHWGTPFETPAEIQALCEAMPEIQLVCDPSHFVCIDAPAGIWQQYFNRIVHVHLRDARKGKLCVEWGTGTVDRSWLGLLKSSGYTGYVTVEYLPSKEGDIGDSIRRCANVVRSA